MRRSRGEEQFGVHTVCARRVSRNAARTMPACGTNRFSVLGSVVMTLNELPNDDVS